MKEFCLRAAEKHHNNQVNTALKQAQRAFSGLDLYSLLYILEKHPEVAGGSWARLLIPGF
jgi:hypothetical protein